MSLNELSSALKCFLELTVVRQRSAKTAYKQGWISVVVIVMESLCREPTGNMKTFLEC